MKFFEKDTFGKVAIHMKSSGNLILVREKLGKFSCLWYAVTAAIVKELIRVL